MTIGDAPRDPRHVDRRIASRPPCARARPRLAQAACAPSSQRSRRSATHGGSTSARRRFGERGERQARRAAERQVAREAADRIARRRAGPTPIWITRVSGRGLLSAGTTARRTRRRRSRRPSSRCGGRVEAGVERMVLREVHVGVAECLDRPARPAPRRACTSAGTATGIAPRRLGDDERIARARRGCCAASSMSAGAGTVSPGFGARLGSAYSKVSWRSARTSRGSVR